MGWYVRGVRDVARSSVSAYGKAYQECMLKRLERLSD